MYSHSASKSREEEKKNIFLTYGANRFLLKCLDKRFVFALHIFAYFFRSFYDITIYTSKKFFLNARIWDGMDIMWLETSSADFTRRTTTTVKFSSFFFHFFSRCWFFNCCWLLTTTTTTISTTKSPHMVYTLVYTFVLHFAIRLTNVYYPPRTKSPLK